MTSIRHMLLALKELGLGKMLRQAVYQGMLWSGYLQIRTPVQAWRDCGLDVILREGIPAGVEAYGRHKHDTCRLLRANRICEATPLFLEPYQASILQQANQIVAGQFPAFGLQTAATTFPPNWFAFLQLGENQNETPLKADRHWARYKTERMPADVKLVWELSRFGWVFPLVRAHCVSRDPQYLQYCMLLLRDWQEHNPPNAGPHWISAQEVGLRILAMAFVIQGAGEALSPADWELLAVLTAAHARRIPPTMLYARAQDNNHLLVEAAALLTAGLVFPELKDAQRWEKMGRRELEEGFQRQVFSDGGYIQHSHNYARVALQTGLWAVFAAKEIGRPLSSRIEDELIRLAGGLLGMLDPLNGKVSNFGPNDGAWIRPVSTCTYSDFRPTLQAASVLLEQVRIFPSGPWDEEALWLGCRVDEADLKVGRFECAARKARNKAGLFRMQGAKSWAVLRCASFNTRPGHADQLHVDIWKDGENVVCDPGTYHYNASAPWENPFSGAGVHNSAWLAGEEPMLRAGRFLWLDRDQGRILGRWRSSNGLLEAISAEHGDLFKGFLHRRTLVRLNEAGWMIVDDFIGKGAPLIRCGWNLKGLDWRVDGQALHSTGLKHKISLSFECDEAKFATVSGGHVLEGEFLEGDPSIYGWYSPTYALKEPCFYRSAMIQRSLPFHLVTWVTFDAEIRARVGRSWAPADAKSPSLQSIEYSEEKLDLTHAYLTDTSGLRSTG
ncbi:MAG: alginate lyase family protein [Anaerolineales bacterium]|nr:alginate lyase family protein [Anaerolineales bacterium]